MLLKELVKKIEELSRNVDNSNEAQSDKQNLDFYKLELRKKDENIKYNNENWLMFY